MATENVKVLKIDTGQAQTSVKDLRNQLKELKDTLLSTEKGTEEYNQALQQAADIQHTLKEQTEELNASAMDFGQITSNLVKTTGGLVAGLQAAKATMNLFGVENEEVLKSLEKMQNLMALTQALPSIDNGIKAFKRLGLAIKSAAASMNTMKAALISTGIGAAVVAVGLLAANWDKVSGALKKWGIIHEDTTKQLEEQRKKLEQLNEELKKAKQAYEDWDKNDKISSLNKKRKEEYEMLSHAVEKYTLMADAAGKARDAENNREKWEELNKTWLELEATVVRYKNLQREILSDEMSFIETVSPKDWMSEDWFLKWKKGVEDQIYADKEKNAIKVPVKLEIEEEDEDTSVEDALAQKYQNIIEMAKEAAITPESIYEEDLRLLNLALEQKKISYEEYVAALKQLSAEEVEIQAQKLNTYLAIANGFSDILGSLADSMDESNKEQFEAAKAFNISAAIISTIAGAIGAYTGAASNAGINAIPIVGPALAQALGIANAAAVTAGGAAQIAQLSRKQFGDKSVNKTSIAKPSTGALTTINAPVQYTQDVQGASIEGAIKDTKVYVTETDISNTQNKVSVTENEARF